MAVDRATMRRKRKSLVLRVVACGLICLLLFRVDFLGLLSGRLLGQGGAADSGGGVGCDGGDCAHRGAKDHSYLRQMMDEQSVSEDLPACSIPHLKSTINLEADRGVQCVRSPASKASCAVAKEMYGDIAHVAHSRSCQYQTRTQHCHTEFIEGRLHVHCNLTACNGQKEIQLGVLDKQTAGYRWTTYSNAADLQTAIHTLAHTDNPGYCIISCVLSNTRKSDKDSPLTKDLGVKVKRPQILNLPPHVPGTNTQKIPLDINIVFIDSTSRHHFFRTLPKSREVLESISDGGLPYRFAKKPLVLDYTLVQAVRSRTYETLETLFSGYINPFEKTFGVQAMPDKALKTDVLLGPLRKLGYRTLWLEDLCPLWEWGISKDLLVYDKKLSKKEHMKKLTTALEKAGISNMGNTFSSCLMLHLSGVPDPFHGPERICFNGQHQHEHHLDYLKLFQETMHAKNNSFFTFFETNVGHEQNGERIVLLDSALAGYLKFVKSLPNTLTVIMSDHGNAYGKYFDRSTEGRVELYQPFIFIIIPPKVQHFITESKMTSLLGNQQKLVSVLDLHYMLNDLIDSLHSSSHSERGDKTFTKTVFNFNKQFHVTKQGLMGNISESRSCSIMPRIMPNLCICKGYETKKSKVSYYHILALFTIGELNNEIQRQRHRNVKEGESLGGFGRCFRLKLVTEPVKNVQDNQNQGDLKSITMDVHISTPVQKQAEIFFVALDVQHGNRGKLTLLNYDRVSIYGKYSVCADDGVPLSLCICDLDTARHGSESSVMNVYNHTFHHMRDEEHHSDKWKLFSNHKLQVMARNIIHRDLEVKIEELEVGGDKCLGIVMQSNDAGVVVEAINVCHVTVVLKVDVKSSSGLALSSTGIAEQKAHPGDVNFLVAGIAEEAGSQWKWEMSISHKIVTA